MLRVVGVGVSTTRWVFILVASCCGVLQAQPGCPAINFLNVTQSEFIADGQMTALVRDLDGSYIAAKRRRFEPFALTGQTENFQEQIAICVPREGGKGLKSHVSSRPLGSPASNTRILLEELPDGTSVGVWTEFRNTTIGIYLENADHSLRSRTQAEIGPQVRSVLDADYDSNGTQDLAVLYFGQHVGKVELGGVAILKGKGDGTFEDPLRTLIEQGNGNLSFAQQDLNDDEKMDFVVSSLDGGLSILLGSGDGTFELAGTLPTVGPSPESVTIVDLDNDGRLDLAVANREGTVSVRLGTGGAAFGEAQEFPAGPQPSFVTTGDVNKDSRIDLVVSSKRHAVVSILLGNGDGTFQNCVSYLGGLDPAQLFVMDFDQDGNEDLVMGDGLPEVLTLGGDQDFFFYVLFGKGDGTFYGARHYDLGRDSNAMALAELNGDDTPDVVTGDQRGVSIILSTAGGAFAEAVPGPAGVGRIGAVAAGDFDRDERTDVVIADQGSDQIRALLSNGDGTLRQAAARGTVASPNSLAVGDFNRDEHLDVAVTGFDPSNPADAALSIHLGNGDGTFQAAQTTATGTGPAWVAVGDWNRDDVHDLAVVNNGDFGSPENPGDLTIFISNGDGTLQTPDRLAAGINPGSLAVGDLNGDQISDLVVATNGENFTLDVAVYIGRVDGTFNEAVLLPTDSGVSEIVIEDFNADGGADLIIGHCCGAVETTFALGNGDGTFQPEEPFQAGGNVTALASQDFNADGRPDLAVLNRPLSRSGVFILLNVSVGPAFSNVSGASFALGPVSPDSIVTAFGLGLATGTAAAITVPLPTILAGTTVKVIDSEGLEHDASFFFADPKQLNYLMPPGVALGTATVTVRSADGNEQSASVEIARIAPGLFFLNGDRLAAAIVIRIAEDGTQTVEPAVRFDEKAGQFVPVPIDMGLESDQVVLALFATGLRLRTSLDTVQATVDGLDTTVLFAGEQAGEGVDQVNLLLSRDLQGRGDVDIGLRVEDKTANTVRVRIE
jgi:uncharacterized protein (TIGR03437 family)